MSTRGVVGFIHNEKIHGKYTHFDSYPEGLGKEIVKFIINSKPDWNKFIKNYEKIEWIQEGDEDPDEIHNKDILPFIYKGKVKILVESIDFATDSLFCEYAYVLDLDNEVLEFYEGFQQEPQEGNRFGTERSGDREDDYYPVKLVGKAPFKKIPKDWMKKFYPEYFKSMEEYKKKKKEDGGELEEGASYEHGGYARGAKISPQKARIILHEGKTHGKDITEKQRKFFGARASGYPVKKEQGGKVSEIMEKINLRRDEKGNLKFDGEYNDIKFNGTANKKIITIEIEYEKAKFKIEYEIEELLKNVKENIYSKAKELNIDENIVDNIVEFIQNILLKVEDTAQEVGEKTEEASEKVSKTGEEVKSAIEEAIKPKVRFWDRKITTEDLF